MKRLAREGLPLNPIDIPKSIATTPHPCGAGVTVDAEALAQFEPVVMWGEAQSLAELYQSLLEGNPIGQSGMAGLIPEKLLWTTIAAYCQSHRMQFDRWTEQLLHAVDAIRLKHEFDRLEKANKPKAK